MNKFCGGCLEKHDTKPDDRLDAGDRPRVFRPDPGESCDFCPEQATSYATDLGLKAAEEPAPIDEPEAKPTRGKR